MHQNPFVWLALWMDSYSCRNWAHALVIWKILFTELPDLPNVDKSFFSVSRVMLMYNYHKPHQNFEILGICQGLGFSKFWVLLWKLDFYLWQQILSVAFLELTDSLHFQYIVFARCPVTVCPSHPWDGLSVQMST